MTKLDIIEAIDLLKDNKALAMVGGAIGAIPCGGAFCIMHGAMTGLTGYMLWGLVATLVFCLAFSVRTVWLFGEGVFGEGMKAVFLVGSLEGLMVFMPWLWAACVALLALVVINAVASVCHLVTRHAEKPRAEDAVIVPSLSRGLRRAVPT